MSNTSRGHDTERKCVLELERMGYVAIRSAASKKMWDVIAICEHDIKLIQCKRTKRTSPSCIRPPEVLAEMRAASTPNSGVVIKELWTWVDRTGWVVTTI